MGLGAAAVNTNQQRQTGSPFGPGSAVNGLSLDGAGRIVLGNDVGGIAAALLNNREIPMAGKTIGLSGAGSLIIGAAGSIGGKLQVVGTGNGIQVAVKLPAGQTIANPIMQFFDSGGVSIGAFRTLTADTLFFGSGVGASLTTGLANVGVGTMFAGSTCMGNVTSGAQNAALGSRALAGLTTGNLNVALGDAALLGLVSGGSNLAIGASALSTISASSGNVGIGQNAGGNGVGAAFNNVVVIGQSCYLNTTAGDANVAIGYQAAGFIGGGGAHGNGNVVVGAQAQQNQAMGTGNVIMGFAANLNVATGNSNILVGSNIIANTLNNVTVIGTGITVTVANVAVLGRADQNALVGFTAAAADNGQRLQVNGGISFNQAAAMLHAVTAMTNNAGAAAGTLTNAPAAGNPTKWIAFDDAGTTRFIPCW